MKLLEGKNAIVTGGSKGIGRAIALKFAEHGANVAFTYLSSVEKAQALEKELQAMGVKAKGFKSDASDYDAAEALVKDFQAEFDTIDIVVNNAGITQDNLLMRMTAESFEKVVDTNLKSVFNLTKACTRPMMKQKGGSIVNISSVVGVMGNAGQANYAASKAGVIGFSKSVARELGSRNVRCNVIAPGFIKTDMTGHIDEKAWEYWKGMIAMGRLGESEEVANAALYFASDLSQYVTSQVLRVDGGMP